MADGSRLTPGGVAWQMLTAAGALGAPAVIMWFVLTHPDEDWIAAVPLRHFLIVGVVSALALAVALLLAIVAVRSIDYRAMLLALGFVVMGGVFTVHAIATPGVLLREVASYGGPNAAGSVLGVSAFLSISLAAALFAAGQTGLPELLGSRMSSQPARWIAAAVVCLVVSYGLLGVTASPLIASLALSLPPASYVLAGICVLLLLFAASHQAARYLSTRRATDGSLLIAFLFLAEAQVAMVLSTPYHFVWWEYHALMLAGVQQAFKSLWEDRGTQLERLARSRRLRELEESLVSNQALARRAREHDIGEYSRWFDVAFDQAVSGLALDAQSVKSARERMLQHVHRSQRGATRAGD